MKVGLGCLGILDLVAAEQWFGPELLPGIKSRFERVSGFLVLRLSCNEATGLDCEGCKILEGAFVLLNVIVC